MINNMNIIDVLIILIILMGAITGLKRGFTREVVSFLGFFLVVVLSFLLKNPISVFLYEHLPFFDFFGFFKGITVLNIALYEVIAFFIALALLTFVFRILLFVSKVFEKLLNVTIILGIPSKILGAIVGLVEGFVWVFILLYIVSLPVFNIDDLEKSKYRTPILEKTPILSEFTKDTTAVIDDFKNLKDEYKVEKDANKFNYDTLRVFLRYNIVDVKSVDKLVEKGKLKISNIEELLRCYREETKEDANCETIR